MGCLLLNCKQILLFEKGTGYTRCKSNKERVFRTCGRIIRWCMDFYCIELSYIVINNLKITLDDVNVKVYLNTSKIFT